MKLSYGLLAALSVLASAPAFANGVLPAKTNALVVTASNTAINQLLVYSPTGTLVSALPTNGKGGASGNAGGIAQNHERLAVVNFGSNTVSIFAKDLTRDTLRLESVIPVGAGPVSVALDETHLYVLSGKTVESHAIDFRAGVSPTADGKANLLIGDGSAAQVGILPGQVVVSEKSNAIETVALNFRGAIGGAAVLTKNIPANVNAPFGLVTRGFDAYVTIAHANEISLVKNNTVVDVTGSGTQMAPCWITLDGPFLFSANSPSQSASRYIVAGDKIVQAAPVVATFVGNPTDITYAHSGRGNGLAAVVDASGATSRVTVFGVDPRGNFTKQGQATIGSAATNGIAIVKMTPDDQF